MAYEKQIEVVNKSGTDLDVEIVGGTLAAIGEAVVEAIEFADTESTSSSGALSGSITGDMILVSVAIAGHATNPTWGTITVGGSSHHVLSWACPANGTVTVIPMLKITGLVSTTIGYTSNNGANHPQAILVTYKEV